MTVVAIKGVETYVTLLFMPTGHIIALLVEERDKLNRAIETLRGATKRRGHASKNPLTAAPTTKHHMRSAAARKAQAERMRAYWKAKKAKEGKK